MSEYSISDAVATYYLYKKHIHDFIFALVILYILGYYYTDECWWGVKKRLYSFIYRFGNTVWIVVDGSSF